MSEENEVKTEGKPKAEPKANKDGLTPGAPVDIETALRLERRHAAERAKTAAKPAAKAKTAAKPKE